MLDDNYPEDTGSAMEGSAGDIPEDIDTSVSEDMTLEEAKALDAKNNEQVDKGQEQPDAQDSTNNTNDENNTGDDDKANHDDPTASNDEDINDKDEVDSIDDKTEDNGEKEKLNATESKPQDDAVASLDDIELPPLKAVGKEIPIDSIEELYSLASKGVKFTQNMQTIKPHYNVVSAMIDRGYTNEDMFLAMDAAEGNIEAMAEFVKRSKVGDLVSVEEAMENDKNYVAENRGEGLDEQDIEYVSKSIIGDKEFGESVKINLNDRIPEDFKNSILSDADSLEVFYEHTKSGLFDKAKPLADKISIMNPGVSYEDAYIQAAKQVESNEASNANSKKTSNNKSKVSKKTIVKEKELNDKRRAVSSTSNNSNPIGNNDSSIDYESIDADSEEFEKMYRKMMM